MVEKIHRFEHRKKKKRRQAEKDFFKLMNNSVFGRAMENITNRMKIELVCNDRGLEKLAAKPSFKDRTILKCDDQGENYLVSIHMGISKLVFNKPIYLGTAILDKVKMYDFHYNVINRCIKIE